jgi:outer membrane protein assembly factor BamE (lipoprotein component of BamABCDE complex)
MLRKDHSELASFDSGSLKKSRRDELYIVYGEPMIKDTGKEKTYIYISYTKLPVSFKGWQSRPSIFYSLKDDLYFGFCLEAKDKLRKDLLAVIEKDIR